MRYPDLLSYKRGQYDPKIKLKNLITPESGRESEALADLIGAMVDIDPNNRPLASISNWYFLEICFRK